MTSNFGGGGAEIYRIVTYTDLLQTVQIPVLHNLYYLLDRGTVNTKKWTKYLPKFKNINDFMLHIRDKFFDEGYCIKNYKKTKLSWDPITLLDSGSGNFLRDAINNSTDTGKILKDVEKQICEFFNFCNEHELNIMMSMDLAGKYTHRQGERDNYHYNVISKGLTTNLQINIELLEKTLDVLKTKDRNFLAFAPIHGSSPQEYAQFVSRLLELEKQKGMKFDGVGLGGLANYRQKKNSVWEIPSDSNARIKAGIIVSRAVKAVRNQLDSINDARPIHALGVGSAELLIPLVHAGADSFDAHSAWRRAIDGNGENAKHVFDESKTGSFSKYLIPLLDHNGNVIKNNKSKVLKYERLNKTLNNIFCDCHVCVNYSISKIKKLYSGDGEEFKFAKILCYVHAITQHQKICERLHSDIKKGEEVTKLVSEIVDQDLKKDLQIILKTV